jgi:hypothetical protein
VFVEKSKRDKIPIYMLMNIVPVSFAEKHRTMLGNVKKWIDMGRLQLMQRLTLN